MQNAIYNELPELISDELIERVKKLSPAQLCDGMEKLGIPRSGCMDAALMPVDPDKLMIGTACTVDTMEGDNFPIHVAIYQGKPGYVLVIAGKAYMERAYLGDLMAGAAAAIGLNGLVVDGCVRDKHGLRDLPIPVYSRGFMQRSPAKIGPGRINTEVECAGIRVIPGDLVVGDYDGVTVIPRDMIEEVLAAAEAKDSYEVKRREDIAAYEKCKVEGTPLPNLAPGWVLDMLNKK
ncbi:MULTISPECIES: RraA family protein [Pelosinus]|uniref:Putative 4-hydroxy-4-methyl-2-oxoglutarate aldolase n=1 Tax=Pelosinus fermentans B4 TaxID=1149862 RepID=I9LF67_9FIRM|nr:MULTISPECIES: RraA family protein [Pelosinus]EIW19011.1 Dimethylmenaquinone methyltransferase [Pelosinus fermentans B4]EIW21779.1 Dimethylmenaquinone methyltransferase [Pelosinus fermentans A11]OAM95372.1 Dimethylmenaquinone methyltransferase [Pelosinus fermentans DSM 17108]SDR27157.1 Regulator of RNase E activity RraA [Pelosinus fermentans]